MKNNQQSKRQGAQFQLTSRFVIILTSLLLLVNVAFVSISLYSVYDYFRHQGDEIVDSLGEAVPANAQEWSALIEGATSKNEDDALKVTLNNGKIYYSKDARAIFNELAAGTALPIFKGVIVADDEIYYFYRQQQSNMTIELAVHGNRVVELMNRMLLISLLLNLFAVFIGSSIIYFFVGKWSRTLQLMTQEIKQIETTNDQEKLLSVPESPHEIRKAATSFNQLLQIQRAAIKRELQFVTDASHELRTPLTAIRGHVRMIKRRGTNHPEVIASSVDFIDKESKRLEILINQLLLLGRKSEEAQLIDVSVLVQQEVEKLQLICSQHVVANITPDVTMVANPLDLQQVCQNLFENAAKYSDQNSSIAIDLSVVEDTLLLQVKDNGIGIPKELQSKIFERFFRVDSSRSSAVEGSGIGLAIVAAIVEKYHGQLSVADNQPQGTIFTVQLLVR